MGDRERFPWSKLSHYLDRTHSRHESANKSKARDALPHPEKSGAESAFRERRHGTARASGSQMERSRDYALTDFVAADAPLQRDSDTFGSIGAGLLSVLVVNSSLVASDVR